MQQYPRLFSPFRLGRLELCNRVAVLPYGTAIVAGGVPGDGDKQHYANIAKSGPGLVVTGATVVHPSSAARNRILTEAYNERAVGSLAAKVALMHDHGCAVFGQLVHLGREWPVGDSDIPPMAPSPIRSPRDAYPPREMTQSDIDLVVEAFGQSAQNLQRAGFDGIEIHAAHGYLVAQFLSPATNRRSDAYGGTAEKRLRFLFEVIDGIRGHCGDAIGLSVRLSADEEIADGLEAKDAAAICRALEIRGGVDLLSITVGTRGGYVKDMTVPDATAANAAIAIRRQCSLPVLLGQRISVPEVAERVLAEGAADLVGMARAFLADPEWLTKAARGDAHRIRPCLNFNQDCRAFSPHLHCAVNPVVGRETSEEFRELRPAARIKKVAVLGGGPGGLEAALTAARRGHRVTVFEKSDSFGGQFLYAAAVPHRQRLRRLVDHQIGELRLLDVDLRTSASVEGPRDLHGDYDAVVVATGARARPLEASLAAAGALRWFDVLEQGAPEPHGNGRAMFVDDGSGFWWNYGVAEALVDAGWRLTLVTPSAAVAHQIPHESVAPLLARLGMGSVEFRVLTALDAVTPSGARIVNLTSGDETSVECALTVVQTGREPVAGPVAALRAGGIAEVHTVGDCVTPRRVSFAVFEGQRVARML
ncbi:MAG TPA: FAD-dependent oxidoreductase [Steroidobacteraceae bacterium]|nr:FAD-dependent oxidoreductase [Steroidobacteraceae bacterium]